MSDIYRLEPIPDTAFNGSQKITIYMCPRCGNQVNRHYNRYKCPHCYQKLAWPGVKYEEVTDHEAD